MKGESYKMRKDCILKNFNKEEFKSKYLASCCGLTSRNVKNLNTTSNVKNKNGRICLFQRNCYRHMRMISFTICERKDKENLSHFSTLWKTNEDYIRIDIIVGVNYVLYLTFFLYSNSFLSLYIKIRHIIFCLYIKMFRIY